MPRMRTSMSKLPRSSCKWHGPAHLQNIECRTCCRSLSVYHMGVGQGRPGQPVCSQLHTHIHLYAGPAPCCRAHGLCKGAHRHLLVYLVQEGSPNEPGPHEADAKGQRGEVEAAVHSAQRAHGVLLVDQHGDVVLAAALRYGPACTTALLINNLLCIIDTGLQSSGTAVQGCTVQSPSLLSWSPRLLVHSSQKTCLLAHKGEC